MANVGYSYNPGTPNDIWPGEPHPFNHSRLDTRGVQKFKHKDKYKSKYKDKFDQYDHNYSEVDIAQFVTCNRNPFLARKDNCSHGCYF